MFISYTKQIAHIYCSEIKIKIVLFVPYLHVKKNIIWYKLFHFHLRQKYEETFVTSALWLKFCLWCMDTRQLLWTDYFSIYKYGSIVQ